MQLMSILSAFVSLMSHGANDADLARENPKMVQSLVGVIGAFNQTLLVVADEESSPDECLATLSTSRRQFARFMDLMEKDPSSQGGDAAGRAYSAAIFSQVKGALVELEDHFYLL